MRQLARDLSGIVATTCFIVIALVALSFSQHRLTAALAEAEARNAAQHAASRSDRAELRAWEQDLMRRVTANDRRIEALEAQVGPRGEKRVDEGEEK